MYAGYVVGVGRRLAAALPVPPADWHHGRAVVVAGAYTLVGAAAYSSLLASFGGLSGFLAVGARSTYVQEDSLFLFAGAVVMRVGVLVALTAWIFRREAWRPSVPVLVFVVLVLALTLMLRGRGRVLSIVVMALFMYHFGRRRLRFRQFALLVAGGVGSLLVLDYVFAYMVGAQLDSGAGLVKELGRSKKLDKLGSIFLVLRGMPAELDFQWGSTIVAVPFDFVPDRWFPDHPEGAAHVFTRTFFPAAYQAGVGIPPSLWTELYMNFGAVGIAVGSFVFGFWLDAMRHLGRVVRSHPGLLLVFVTLLYYTVSLLTSVLETSVPHMMVDVAPAAAAALFVTRFRLYRQHPAARPAAGAPAGPARQLTGTAG
jgi:oligosaccharide repeat unit polymerase